MNHLFGPVASRRLGRSLGVDLLPFKTCTLDCVYCECGCTTNKTLDRAEYVPFDEIISEITEWYSEGGKADYITLAGSGEPTLHSRFGDIISTIKQITNIPVCVLTNATLFSSPEIFHEIALADLVVPSLDAADETTFLKINRPAEGLDFGKYIEGLILFSEIFSGKLWLEIFVVPEINDNEKSIKALAEIARKIRPDKIQLNTAVRPTAEKSVKPVSLEKMKRLAKLFTPEAEIIAAYHHTVKSKETVSKETVFELLRRRPGTLEDISSGLSIKKEEAEKYVCQLLEENLITKIASFYLATDETRMNQNII
jgi:wyosine [tRNA(Phe)-imidazoG37] synthetase (radical SAM superfamily)